MISDETNGKIKDKAPAGYLVDPEIFSSGANAELPTPHFLDDACKKLMSGATEAVSNDDAAALYGRFVQAREAAIIGEIRKACGIALATDVAEVAEADDEVAADVKDGTASLLEPIEEAEFDLA